MGVSDLMSPESSPPRAPMPSSSAPRCSRAAPWNLTRPISRQSATRRRWRAARRSSLLWSNALEQAQARHRKRSIMALEIFSLRERPDLRPLIFAAELQSVWPEFARHDAAAGLYFGPSMYDRYLDYAFAAVFDGKVVGRAFSVPFTYNIDDRAELPDGGWDQVIRWAHDDQMIGRTPTALSALEISLLPEARRGGNSLALLGAMKACAKARGFTELFAPVRPNQKHLQPRMPMRDYIDSVRPDGLRTESWLRTHLCFGGNI